MPSRPSKFMDCTTLTELVLRTGVGCVWSLFVSLSTMGCVRSSLSDGLSDRQDCTSCHGTAGNAAPPKALNGAVATTEIGVGAHQAHLLGGSTAGPIACEECHRLPTDLLTHPDIDARRAEVVFGNLATRNGAQPTWDRSSVSCAKTYCHGSTLANAPTLSNPVWTTVDGSQRRCTSCHGFPPAGTHPSGGSCDACHGAVAGPGGTIQVPSRHVDGTVDFGPTSYNQPRARAHHQAYRPRAIAV